MAFVDTTTPNANISFQKGNPFYVTLLTIVAALGGLLFGYDTAVVNGAEKALVDFYITKIADPSFHAYAVSMVSQYHTLLVIVLFIVFVVICGQIIKLLNIKKDGVISLIILALLTWWAVDFLNNPDPLSDLNNTADAIKGFVIASALIGCIIGGAVAGFVSWMFFSGVIPAGLFFILLFFVPETPRYLALKGKDDKALQILQKISGKNNALQIL